MPLLLNCVKPKSFKDIQCAKELLINCWHEGCPGGPSSWDSNVIHYNLISLPGGRGKGLSHTERKVVPFPVGKTCLWSSWLGLCSENFQMWVILSVYFCYWSCCCYCWLSCFILFPVNCFLSEPTIFTFLCLQFSTSFQKWKGKEWGWSKWASVDGEVWE